MCDTSLQDQIDAATFEFAMGESALAEQQLNTLAQANPESFSVWHALTEVRYAQKDFSGALEAAETAHTLKPKDIHINTSLSRIWVQFEDKEKAEHFGAQARVLGWQDTLNNPDENETL
jgi:cytochrome c-type biogenesis protein CcmH/NrfG